jgi:hypothetical protein
VDSRGAVGMVSRGAGGVISRGAGGVISRGGCGTGTDGIGAGGMGGACAKAGAFSTTIKATTNARVIRLSPQA